MKNKFFYKDILYPDTRVGKTSLLTYLDIMKSAYVGIVKSVIAESDNESDLPLKCINCPSRREYPYRSVCLIDIGGEND